MDKQTLQAALQNMVKNSMEAMSDGGQLMVRTRMMRSGVAVDLIDTGQGIGSSTLIKMFEPFYTTKDSGSGLGLPMAKKVIEAHGGVIMSKARKAEARSSPSNFRSQNDCDLPRRDEPSRDIQNPPFFPMTFVP